ncbi:unnamed protein product [Discula destructiva]
MKRIIVMNFILTACLTSTTLALSFPTSLQRRRSTNSHVSLDPGPPKYFQEPGGDDVLGHYDSRYFQGLISYDDHLDTLRHLIRSYLTVFRALGVDTWLAHGTLLGWWWNGRVLPWDYDLDMQVTASSIGYLAAHYNRTRHEYRYVDAATGAPRTKVYLLDVNPHHVDRARGNMMNVIDARWIDTDTGMFVDITGLGERPGARDVWGCKNNHWYKTTNLFPMRETEFEGVTAMVPFDYDLVLTGEYGRKSLVTTKWLEHEWDPEIKEWVKQHTNQTWPT